MASRESKQRQQSRAILAPWTPFGLGSSHHLVMVLHFLSFRDAHKLLIQMAKHKESQENPRVERKAGQLTTKAAIEAMLSERDARTQRVIANLKELHARLQVIYMERSDLHSLMGQQYRPETPHGVAATPVHWTGGTHPLANAVLMVARFEKITPEIIRGVRHFLGSFQRLRHLEIVQHNPEHEQLLVGRIYTGVSDRQNLARHFLIELFEALESSYSLNRLERLSVLRLTVHDTTGEQNALLSAYGMINTGPRLDLNVLEWDVYAYPLTTQFARRVINDWVSPENVTHLCLRLNAWQDVVNIFEAKGDEPTIASRCTKVKWLRLRINQSVFEPHANFSDTASHFMTRDPRFNLIDIEEIRFEVSTDAGYLRLLDFDLFRWIQHEDGSCSLSTIFNPVLNTLSEFVMIAPTRDAIRKHDLSTLR